MTTNFEKVREFHEAADCPVHGKPTLPSRGRRGLRLRLIGEEFDELCAAASTGDLVGIADGLADLLYVVYGAGHEYGIQLDHVFEEVHRSNMSKLDDSGKPLRRSDGKILKGPNFSPPDIRAQLQRRNVPNQRVRKRLIYLASPYSHPDPAVQEQRFEAVAREAARMMAEGQFVYSPIAHTHPIAKFGELPKGFDFWEAYDAHLISLCTELVVLKLEGWDQSKGVAAEIKIAQALNIPVTYREASHD